MSDRMEVVAADLRAVCLAMLAAKREKAAGKSVDQVSLADLSAQGAVLVQETKAIARDVFIATQKSRDGVIGTQRLADVDNLQLENLRYEKGYLLRDIQRCRNFSTVETDKIALVPVEEFLTSAPPHLTAVSEAENPHKFFMNRLAHELEMRKKCSTELEEMAVKRRAVVDSTAERKSFLESLPAQLKAVAKATAPLQKAFSQRVTKKLRRQAESRSLSGPLYVLFCQLEALEDGHESEVAVSIRATTPDGSLGSRGSLKRGRGEDEGVDDRSQKRGPGVHDKGGEAADEAADVLRPAPLEVCLTLEMRGAVTASTQLVFRYLPVLRIITVECDGDQSLLVSLLPHDTGEMTPRLSNHHVKVADGSFLDASSLFPSSAAARPYHWAQWLGGLYVLPPVSAGAEARLEPSTRAIVELIKRRVVCRKHLEKQLTSLCRGSPPSVHKDCEALLPVPEPPAPPMASLVSVSLLSKHEVEDIAHWFPAVGSVPPGARRCVLKAVAGGAVDDAMDGEGAEGDAAADSGAGAGGGRQIAPTAAAAASAVKEPTSGYECRYLHAVVSSRDEHLQVLVEVAPDYPTAFPRFRLCRVGSATSPLVTAPDAASRSAAIENIERYLNVAAPQELAPTADAEPFLLSHQLRALQIQYSQERGAGSGLGLAKGAPRPRLGPDRSPVTQLH